MWRQSPGSECVAGGAEPGLLAEPVYEENFVGVRQFVYPDAGFGGLSTIAGVAS